MAIISQSMKYRNLANALAALMQLWLSQRNGVVNQEVSK